MNQSVSAQAIDEQAARFVARISAGPLDADTRRELKQWACEDRHRGALFRALTLWQMVGDESEIDPFVFDVIQNVDQGGESAFANACEQDRTQHPDQDAIPADTGAVTRRRWLWAGGALAASLVPLAFAAQYLNSSESQPSQSIRTALGEVTEVPLRDRSLVVLNTASQLELNETPEMRAVRLREGEAWFQVAKDPNRPFVVASGDVRVRAIGTAFSVRRLGEVSEVQVTEGVVEVWTTQQRANRVRITAGARTFVSDRLGVQAMISDAEDIERKLSWRQGWLTFRGTTLREAVEEFNRYNVTKLEVDPALANEKIVGRFSTREPDSFARVVSLTFDARIEKEGTRIRVAQ